MALADELAAISAKIDAAVASALENEVADAVKAKMQDVLESEIYSYNASDFFMGTRRYDNGGLMDTRNMTSWTENGDTLYVQNDAEAQSLWEDTTRMLDVIVTNGALNYGPHAGKHDFYGDTESQAVQSGDVERALQAGLNRQGF